MSFTALRQVNPVFQRQRDFPLARAARSFLSGALKGLRRCAASRAFLVCSLPTALAHWYEQRSASRIG
ncbi:hypothetical protein KCP76_19485 [Salmonella enterica subsp. enterica serovar Weltevreden]|nr:hypothetical protein KCP76_19485 [Salmonella enterica subsp. enterica serovar Weltevreden]